MERRSRFDLVIEVITAVVGLEFAALLGYALKELFIG
jgi:hypothetical protein